MAVAQYLYIYFGTRQWCENVSYLVTLEDCSCFFLQNLPGDTKETTRIGSSVYQEYFLAMWYLKDESGVEFS